MKKNRDSWCISSKSPLRDVRDFLSFVGPSRGFQDLLLLLYLSCLSSFLVESPWSSRSSVVPTFTGPVDDSCITVFGVLPDQGVRRRRGSRGHFRRLRVLIRMRGICKS